MKRCKLFLGIIMIIVLTTALTACKNNEQYVEDVPMLGSFAEFNYEELENYAKIIAKVQITNTLNEDESYTINDPETGSMGGFYGKRTCKVLEYYKDTTGKYEEEFSFIEAAAIIDGRYFHIEGYEALKEGNEYIVFLSDETASKDMSIISCNNGVVRLAPEEKSMNYSDIAEKAIEKNTKDIRYK